jgi:hypothetical protein
LASSEQTGTGNEQTDTTQPMGITDPSGIDPGSVGGQSFTDLFIGNFIQSTNWQPKVRGFYLDGRTGYAEFSDVFVTGTITAATLKYGKGSFTDSTNAGYFISSLGVYVGSAADATKLKYTVADGSFDFIGTISSRSTATIAAAINASGNLITDIINARLDSDSKKILADFNFGTTDYAGAVKAGTVTWNTTTGAITGGSGVVVYRGGIVGVNTGVATFTLDAVTGNATFAGTLSAPTGTLGTITSATITAGSFQTATSGQRIALSGSDNTLRFYDSVGQVIGIGSTAGSAIKLDLNATTTTGINMLASVASTMALYYKNTGNVTNKGVFLELTGATNDGIALEINHDGSGGYGIFIDSSGAARSLGIFQSGTAIGLYLDNSGTGKGLYVLNTGNGIGGEIEYDGTNIALNIISTDTGAGAGIKITHTAGGTAALLIDKNNSYAAIEIDQDVNDAAATIGLIMSITNAGAGTEFAFDFGGSEAGITAAGNAGFVSNSKGTFTLQGFVRVRIGNSDTRYIPYGDIS